MSFSNIKFTTKGRNLHAKVQAGATLNFTKLAIGDGDNGGASSDAYDNLLNTILNITITKIKATSDGSAIVGGIFNNSGLAAFYFREIALFATDPDLGEILYCYGNAGATAEYIPAGEGSTILERQLNIVAVIGNATSLSANIDYSMYATMEFVQNGVANHNISGVAHADIREHINSLGAKKADGTNVVFDGTDVLNYNYENLQKIFSIENPSGIANLPSQVFGCLFYIPHAWGGELIFTSVTPGNVGQKWSNIRNAAGWSGWLKLATTKQGDWITATLQNGWEGIVKYSKDDLGYVTLEFNAYGGTITPSIPITNIQTGYRPNVPIPFSITAEAAVDQKDWYVILGTDGNIKVGKYAGIQAGYMGSNQISYKAV